MTLNMFFTPFENMQWSCISWHVFRKSDTFVYLSISIWIVSTENIILFWIIANEYGLINNECRKTLRNWLNEIPDLIQDISWEKGQHKKDAIKDITSDSQVNSYFPYRWSPASLTFNIYLQGWKIHLCLLTPGWVTGQSIFIVLIE